ncbi:hypothetical protein MACK_002268 [Theileria orientalis]|uniref:LEM3/CDC50 family protein n=1 Tax=Theileria orientalis TaxID=68886 RepID=A0A976MDI9_THEOR|nr:hypothetical protein MACK_002268 [Theileria orientalis]
MDKESLEMGTPHRKSSVENPPDRENSEEFDELLDSGLENPSVQSETSREKLRKDVSIAMERDYVWLPSSRGMGPNYTSRIERMKQMDLKANYFVYNMYTPVGAATLSLVLGALLLMLALVMLFLSMNVHLEVPYSEKDNAPITITITKDFKPPIYVYYKINDFYVTHKKVVYDSEPAQVSKSSCKTFNTFAEILELRCIEGKNTLNGVDEWCIDYKNNPKFNIPVYPCGPLAATLMTDNFEICSTEIPKNALGNYEGVDFDSCLDIQIQDEPELWKFSAYRIKSKKFARGFCWLDVTNPLYHTWLQHPYSSKFLKPYGVIHDQVEPGEYKIHLVNNLWPSEAWKAKKSIYITCTNFLGTKSIALEIVLICISGLYLLTGIILLVLHFSGFKTKLSPWRGLYNVETGAVTEKEEFVRRASTVSLEVNLDKIPKKPGKCLCPLHL